MPANRLVVLSDGISDEQAAARMLKGMTAQYLIRQTYKVKELATGLPQTGISFSYSNQLGD
jgi:NADPH:quinone reductase-like Zn-dependent oxidoreductase